MKILSLSFLALAACASANTAEVNARRAKAYREEGDAAYKAKAYGRAVEHYSNSIQCNPEYADSYYWRGNSWRMLALEPEGKTRAEEALANAVSDYQFAVNRNPMHYEAYFNRGCISMTLARPKDAASDFLRCTQLRDKDAEPHLYLGQIYETWFEDGKLMALDHYEKYTERGGSDPDVMVKVRQYREAKKLMQPPTPVGKGPTAEDEKKAQELREQAMEFAKQGKKDETFKTLDELLTKYAGTKFVKDNKTALTAMRMAFAPKK